MASSAVQQEINDIKVLKRNLKEIFRLMYTLREQNVEKFNTYSNLIHDFYGEQVFAELNNYISFRDNLNEINDNARETELDEFLQNIETTIPETDTMIAIKDLGTRDLRF